MDDFCDNCAEAVPVQVNVHRADAYGMSDETLATGTYCPACHVFVKSDE